MGRAATMVFAMVPALLGQAIREYPLDAYKAVDLPVSGEVTTITWPAPLTAVAGADMLIEHGVAAGRDVDEDAPLRFHVTHAPGSNFVLVRSLQPNAHARLSVIFEGAAYVLQLRSVADDSIASAIFKRPQTAAAVKVARPPEPVTFTSRVGLSLLDRARSFPVLERALPQAVADVTRRIPGRKIDLPDLEITLDEVQRFSREDAVVFLLTLRNKTTETLDVAPGTFAARVGDEKFPQAIANGPRTLAPGETAEAEFAIVGLPDGTRNDLSVDNAFTIVVNSSRRTLATATTEGEGPKS